jgi:hypothetical protein
MEDVIGQAFALWAEIHPIWKAIGVVTFLFYKKAVSDLEVATGYVLNGTVTTKWVKKTELRIRSKKLRYSLWFFPNPIFAELMTDKEADDEIKRKADDFLKDPQNAEYFHESSSIDFRDRDALFVLKVTSQEQKAPRVIASMLNHLAMANVYTEFQNRKSGRRISYLHFRVQKPGVEDGEVAPLGHWEVDFRLEWDGKPRLVGRILNPSIHRFFINEPRKQYRAAFEFARRQMVKVFRLVRNRLA